MTKDQALNNLSLSADADVETIRLRFGARYTLSDLQYDRTLTEGMKGIHEQHLRELEDSFKLLTDSSVIADMGALLSLGKGYVEEDNESIGRSETVSPEEALAFFALYPYDTVLLAEKRYQQYCDELHFAMDEANLEASKEPFRKELLQAETYLTVAVNYLLAGQVISQIPSYEIDSSGNIETEQTENISEREEIIDSELGANNKGRLILGVVVIVVCVLLYLLIK